MAKGIRGGRKKIKKKPVKKHHAHPTVVFTDNEWILLTLDHIDTHIEQIRSMVEKRLVEQKVAITKIMKKKTRKKK